MAFFDNLGKKISDAGQNVAQQTKNLADITQLNSTISEKQKTIQQLYLSLGQAYYESHKEDPLAEQGELVQKINELFTSIAQCRDKIIQIRGTVTCPNCGAELPVRSQFCNSCGTKIEKVSPPAEPEEHLCPNCGCAVPEGNQFCIQCGTRL